MSFTTATVITPVERFHFNLFVPEDWAKVELQPERPDFSDSATFLALAVFVDERTMAIVSVAARPGYAEGTVLDWLGHAAGLKGIQLDSLQPFDTATGRGASGLAVQQNDGGPTRLRVVAVEDGGNLFMLTGMCPVDRWDDLSPLLGAVLASFDLIEKRGQTVPLVRDGQAGPTPPKSKTCADLALARDASSLDPNHAINAGIRDSGAGLVPRVVSVDVAAGKATVAAAAIAAVFDLPLGWHAIDDGRRTFVFDPGNQIQVNFNLLFARGGRGLPSSDETFRDILADVARQNPDARFQKFDLDGMPAMVVKGQVINGEALEQAYVLRRIAARPDALLKCRATSSAENLVRAGDLLNRGARISNIQ
jgi:hypothetical protein